MNLFKNNDNPINEEKIINTLRTLSIDMMVTSIEENPRGCLGAAPILYTLYANHVNIVPERPNFFNRDHVILSASNLTPLLYATLFLAGFHIELEDLKKYGRLDSIVPQRPNHMKTPGVDITTNHPGMGLATGVGIAMGEAHAESLVNDNNKVIEYYTYILADTKDMMEGSAKEAASLAGTLNLNKLIILYHSDDMLEDGKTDTCFTENIRESYEAMNWNTFLVNDSENLALLNKTIEDAKKSNKPTLIEIKSSPTAYLKEEETLTKESVTTIKNKLNMRDIPFTVTNDVMEDFQYLITERNKKLVENFENAIFKLDSEKRKILDSLMLPNKRISSNTLDFEMPKEEEALTEISEKLINAYHKTTPLLFGGGVDTLKKSKVKLEDSPNFSSTNYFGGNIYFGVRPNASASILNGLGIVGFRPYIGCPLILSDYMKPSIRMSAMMNIPAIYIFTHDSIAGEEEIGQPIEQLSMLRTIPDFEIYRPADANEVMGCYKAMMQKEESPVGISLSSNKLPILENTSINDTMKGGYIVKKEQLHLDGILISCGEELQEVIKIAENLFSKGIDVRVVSMPCLSRFLKQEKSAIDEILPVEKQKIVIEFTNSLDWNKIVFDDKYIIRKTTYGESGAKEEVLKKYHLDRESLEERIENLLK